MIHTQKQYEKYKNVRCGHSVLQAFGKIKMIIFNVLFLLLGLAIVEFGFKGRNETLYDRAWFYTLYLSFMIFWIHITRLLTW